MPEWGEPVPRGEPEIVIECRNPAPHVPAGPDSYDRARDVLAFSQAGAGQWTVEKGTRIVITPDSTATSQELRLFTLGSAWGALGYQRGWSMWHSSAVSVGDRTAFFCGESGQGKSTMAAAMARRGHRLVADDLSRVEPETGTIWPSASRLKLWNSALGALGWAQDALHRDHFEDDRYHLPMTDAASRDLPLPMGGIFVLVWSDEVRLERLRGSVAVTALSEAVMYRKAFLELMGRLSGHVVGCARIAAQVPVWRLTRPRDFGQIDTICRATEEAMQTR